MLSQGRDPKKERVVERGSAETFGPFADACLKSILPGFKGSKPDYCTARLFTLDERTFGGNQPRVPFPPNADLMRRGFHV
jgi:hypothetical protein